MKQVRFEFEELPYDTLSQFGLTREMIEDLPMQTRLEHSCIKQIILRCILFEAVITIIKISASQTNIFSFSGVIIPT